MDQFLDFLEAQDARPDPNDPSNILPAHGAALCMSAADWTQMKMELEEACRELGDHCTVEMQNALNKF